MPTCWGYSCVPRNAVGESSPPGMYAVVYVRAGDELCDVYCTLARGERH